MSKTTQFSHLWNDLPIEERRRLLPSMVESHRLHIWQSKQKAIRAHNALMKDFNEHLASLDSELRKYAKEAEKP